MTSGWDKFYQKLNLIFNGIVASSMIPFALLFLQNQRKSLVPVEELEYLKYPFIFLSMAMAIAGHLLWSKKWIRKIRSQHTVEAKLDVYLMQKLKKFAFFEAGAIVALLGFFLLQLQFFVFVYVGILVVFSIYRPTFKHVCKDIGETEENMVKWTKAHGQ